MATIEQLRREAAEHREKTAEIERRIAGMEADLARGRIEFEGMPLMGFRLTSWRPRLIQWRW